MTYADGIRAVGGLTGDAIGDLIEGALASLSVDSGTTLINTSSTSDTAYTGASIAVTVASGEQILAIALVTVSNSSSLQSVSATIYEDGVAKGLAGTYVASRSSSAGAEITVPVMALITPSVGAHTYTIYWKCSGGTAYSSQFYFLAAKIRTS